VETGDGGDRGRKWRQPEQRSGDGVGVTERAGEGEGGATGATGQQHSWVALF
jgi:hypothetical protein